MKKFIIPLLIAALCAVGIFASTAGASPAREPVPSCHQALVSIGSKTYHVGLCNTPGNVWFRFPPAGKLWNLSFSGGLANGSYVFASQVPAPSPSPSPSPSPAVVTTAASGYPNPNGTHFHCEQYTYPSGHGLDSWDCISGYGFLYAGVWAFVSDFYQHPNPSSDEVVNETYFNQSDPNGMTKTAQWRHRLIAVNDNAVEGLVEPFDWRVSAGDTNPPAPVTCLVLTGDQQGQQIPCTPLVQQSILDYWHQANVVPSQVAW